MTTSEVTGLNVWTQDDPIDVVQINENFSKLEARLLAVSPYKHLRYIKLEEDVSEIVIELEAGALRDVYGLELFTTAAGVTIRLNGVGASNLGTPGLGAIGYYRLNMIRQADGMVGNTAFGWVEQEYGHPYPTISAGFGYIDTIAVNLDGLTAITLTGSTLTAGTEILVYGIKKIWG